MPDWQRNKRGANAMTDPTELRICLATEADAEAISAVVVNALRTTNAKDYPPSIIERVARSYSPNAIQALVHEREVLVALHGGRVVGTGSLDGSVIRTFFVDPGAQGTGVGRSLMRELEWRARARGLTRLSLTSSITAEQFYARMGFVAIREEDHDGERTIEMERHL